MSDPTFLAALGALTMESAPVFADALTENAARFTCGEADAIRNLLAACGLDGDAFLTSHAMHDQEGDSHYRGRFIAPPSGGLRCGGCGAENLDTERCPNTSGDAVGLCLDCCEETH